MKSNHQIRFGRFLLLHHLLPELMVEALIGADVDPLLGAERPQRRPHNGAVHHLRSNHDDLNALVARKHVVELVVVSESGRQRLIVARSHQMDGEGFGAGVEAEQPHSPGYRQGSGEELTADPPQGLSQFFIDGLRPARVSPQVLHIFPVYDGIQSWVEISLHDKPVVPTFDLRLGL